MENIIKIYSQLTPGEISIYIGLMILIFFVPSRVLYLNIRTKKTNKVRNPKKNTHWTPERLLTYYRNSQEDPRKYGYTIFSSYE